MPPPMDTTAPEESHNSTEAESTSKAQAADSSYVARQSDTRKLSPRAVIDRAIIDSCVAALRHVRMMTRLASGEARERIWTEYERIADELTSLADPFCQLTRADMAWDMVLTSLDDSWRRR